MMTTKAMRRILGPVVASLNGQTAGGWTPMARQFQDAGADAIELNVYFLAASVDDPSAEVEQRYVHLVRSVTPPVSHPVAVRAPPQFRRLANLGRAARESVGINVRQPLAEVVCVLPVPLGAEGAEAARLARELDGLLRTELNVKAVRWAESGDSLVTLSALAAAGVTWCPSVRLAGAGVGGNKGRRLPRAFRGS